MLDAFRLKEGLDEVKHRGELRENNRLLALTPLIDLAQKLQDHPDLRRARRQVRVCARLAAGLGHELVARRAVLLVVRAGVARCQDALTHLAPLCRPGKGKASDEVREVVGVIIEVFLVLGRLGFDCLLVLAVVL